MWKHLAALTLLILTVSCQSLPIDGPLASDVREELSQHERVPYSLVTLRPDIVPILNEVRPDAEEFIADLGPSEPKIGPGDALGVTIVEPSAGGLFSSAPSILGGPIEPGARVVTLPEQTVDPDGRITVPFGGGIDVRGLSHVQAAERIRGALTGQAVNPQVQVSAATSLASRITVAGAVKTPGVLPLLAGGETLLEAIARAGASTDMPENIVVQLTRFNNAHRVRMQTLLERPESNIHVRAGDYIHLLVQPRKYLVLGATEKVDDRSLGLQSLRLATALARVGGLLDIRADARSVMVFRYESPAVLDRIAVVDARLARARGEDAPIPPQPGPRTPSDPMVPVVFVINMRSASGLFMAQQLEVRESDLIYAPNSPYSQWQKFLDLIRITVNPFAAGALAAKGL